MKATQFSSLPKFTTFGGAPYQRNNYVFLSFLCLIIVTLWNTHSVTAAPAKLDFQPPIFEASSTPSDGSTTIDSYGNPIGSLQPIQTPDGRKVVSAQGLQFEIPNYASGITELKKPADDLLPPFIDPIVVALPADTSSENLSTNPGPSASAEQTTSIDVESVPLVELKQQETGSHEALISKSLPDYILALNDPDIGGAVEYKPAEDKRGLNVIAWDLLPPLENDLNEEKPHSHNSLSNGHNLKAAASQESSRKTVTQNFGSEENKETKPGEANYYTTTSTTTTPRTTYTTTPRTTTSTTARTTTTPRTTRTTTTRRTTTPRTTTRTTTTTTTPEPDSSEFFRLEQGDSYTLPPWLQDIDDPDLDVAVTFEIPEDINEYNHTIERDLLAPLEPYTDLSNIHLTPPTNLKEDSTTTERTTPTTTRRPTSTTYTPHWVRAKTSTPKPTIATFNKQFTSLSPSILSSTSFAQSTTSTTTTVKPQTSIAFYNRQLSSNTAQTDKIAESSSSENENRLKSTNPFLRQFDDGKYKPQQNGRRSTTSTTTTTTTTTTPAPISYEKNPFEATIPPWLKDFDYPDLGPGVPFIYDPNEDENPVDKNILPPTKSDDEPNPTNPNSNSPFLNSQTPQGFTNKISTSALSLTSSSSIPSITTIPFPSAQQTNQDDSTLTRPPHVFVPPKTADSSTTFNKNFPAPFDSSAASVNSEGEKKVPLSADRESFPPFNNIITGSSTVPNKTTFSKSEDGKVITNNIFLNGGLTSSKPLGATQEKTTLTTQSSSGSALTTSAAASAFVTTATFGSGSSSEGNKYTGRFGGPPGVLAPQVNDFSASSSSVTKSINQPAVTKFGITPAPAVPTNNKDRFSGSFGGPPGILKPYDNIKNR